MANPLFNAAISRSDTETILASLQTVRQTLPFLIGLTPIEKLRLRKIGIKSQTFVERALDAAEQYPDVMPRCLDVDASRQNLELFKALNPILQTLNELQELVECTQMLAGSEAYASARLAYRSVKAVGKGNGMNAIVDELARQFRSTRRQTGASNSASTSPTANGPDTDSVTNGQ